MGCDERLTVAPRVGVAGCFARRDFSKKINHVTITYCCLVENMRRMEIMFSCCGGGQNGS